jgi:hypothetical protein
VSPQLIGGIFGALTAGVITLVLKLAEWYLRRSALNRALRKGLYFEVKSHRIVEVDEDSNRPRLSLLSFHDHFFRESTSDLIKTLGDDLIQKLIFYYTHLNLASDVQDELLRTADRLPTAPAGGPQDEARRKRLMERRTDLQDTLSSVLSAAAKVRRSLLTELKRVFENASPATGGSRPEPVAVAPSGEDGVHAVD